MNDTSALKWDALRRFYGDGFLVPGPTAPIHAQSLDTTPQPQATYFNTTAAGILTIIPGKTYPA